LELICFFSCLTTIVFGQDSDENLPNSPYGSATDLKGKTVVINCFVSKVGNEWTTEEKEKVLSKQNDGLGWLQKQASRWKVDPLSFEVVNLGLEKDISVDHIDYAFDMKKIKKLQTHWATFSLHAAGIRNIYQYYDTLKTNHKADNVVVIVFANENGRSYAQPTIEKLVKMNKDFILEGAVVYKTGYNNLALYSGTIVHEMLHLFGAWDMYLSETRSSDIDRRINGAFQHSIMLHDHDYNIYQFNIDQMTGWCIGWTKTYWPWYEMFRTSNQKEYWKSIPGMVEKD